MCNYDGLDCFQIIRFLFAEYNVEELPGNGDFFDYV